MTAIGHRILYVDDDEGLRRLVGRALERRGYRVTLASGGAEALEMAAEEPFDIIALDHYMPGQDGLTTLEALRRQDDATPIVYVTGSDETSVAVAALKAGAMDYVVKTAGEDFFDLLERAFAQAIGQVRLRREKEAAEEAVRVSNTRLEALLREVNHRVANSLQMVAAFVQMQSSGLRDVAAREAFQSTQQRIGAIMQVHRRLYSSGDVETVQMAEYLAGLLRELEESWSTPSAPRRLDLTAEPIRLPTDKAVSLGVIVNELVTNACKYAYADDIPGAVRVRLESGGTRRVCLVVEDDGVGLPSDGLARGTGLGAKLIAAMARSLGGEVVYDLDHPGVRVTIRFKAT